MRPLRLEMAGFGSFRDPTTVELDDADLFVLSGPTGAGKSTIIDAIVFALYGKVPRLADDRAVEPVISRGLSEARVRCTFRSRGDVHTATRVVRRTRGGGASTKEARLETADGRVLAGNVRELDERVTALLGLEFEHFTRCVVLPQGAFQAFLHARGSERQKLLSSLLNLGIYADLRRRAGEEEAAAKARLQATSAQLEGRLANASAEAVADAEQRATALVALRARLEDAGPTYEQLLADGRAAAQRERRAGERHAALTALERPPDVDDTSARLAALDGRLARATAARDEAATTLEAARSASETHPSVDAVEARANRVRRLTDARDAVVRGTTTAAQAAEVVAERQATVAATTDESAAATAAVDRARDRARATTLAAGLEAGDDCPVCLRELDEAPSHLHGGAATTDPLEDDQPGTSSDDLATTPAGADPPRGEHASRSVHDAEAAEAAAVAAAQRAREDLSRAERAEATARATLAAAEAQVASLADEVAGSELPDDLERLGALATVARRLDTERTVAEETARKAARGLAAAEAAVAAASERRRAASEQLVTARDDVAAVGWTLPAGTGTRHPPHGAADHASRVTTHPPPTETLTAATGTDAITEVDTLGRGTVTGGWRVGPAGRAPDDTRTGQAMRSVAPGPPAIDPAAPVAAGWDALLAWRDDRLVDVEAELAAARAAAASARDRYRALLTEHRASARELGVVVGDGGGQPPLVAVAAATATAEAAVVRCKEDLAERDRVRAEAKEARQEQQLLRTLAQRLDRKNFQQWLLNRALARVVSGATDILHDLSGGAYRLAVEDDGSFAVIDRANADERRSVRTLSGGETFLASLALALALSDHVVEMAADGAAPLETLFIDEGFGTLDAETLQVVAAALHELSASGRAVGIVTHVAELARLVPTRFEVRKVGNASTVTRIEAEL